MAYTVKLTNDLLWGANQDVVRILEFRADSEEEVLHLVNCARKKHWFVWLSPQPIRTGGWGAVMEKDMPDSAVEGFLLEAELAELAS
jgi:hypothetical protein